MTLTVRVTPESFVFAAQEKIKEVTSVMRYYELHNPCYDRGETEDLLKKANANLPSLDKCIDGIKNAKAALILGGMYYLLTPMLATFLAGTMTKTEKEE